MRRKSHVIKVGNIAKAEIGFMVFSAENVINAYQNEPVLWDQHLSVGRGEGVGMGSATNGHPRVTSGLHRLSNL